MKRLDRTGMRYGMLEVIGKSNLRGNRGKRTVPLWECRCDCGAIVYRAMDTLTGPGLHSCPVCASMNNTSRARQNAGFYKGIQLGKLVGTESSSNMSGRRGVYYERKTGKWRSSIKFRGKKINLGSYEVLSQAIKAREQAEEYYIRPLLEEAGRTGSYWPAKAEEAWGDGRAGSRWPEKAEDTPGDGCT